MNHRVWINFKELRARLKFEDVLRHYKVEVHRKESQHVGSCPLPGQGGDRNPQSFSANLDRGIFQCFGCGAKGNVLEFAALMSGIDPKDGSALRKVAVELQAKFFPEGASTRTKPEAKTPEPAKTPAPAVLVNAPLDFALKDLDATHRHLLSCGFTAETIKHFGLGFCSRGLLKDRVAIPLHDQGTKLIGYAGLALDGSALRDDRSSYLYPTKRERNGTVLDFQKSLFLYNGSRIQAPCDDLIVVQSFPSVWWLHQNGFPQVVALMGPECSEKQVELIALLTKSTGRVWIVPNGGKAGDQLARALLWQLSANRSTRRVKLEDDCQPTDLSGPQLRACFQL